MGKTAISFIFVIKIYFPSKGKNYRPIYSRKKNIDN